MSRLALDQHHHLCNVLLTPKGDQQVQVIRPTVDTVEKDFLLSSIDANVLYEFSSQVPVEDGFSILCAEDHMNPDPNE